MLTLEDYNSRKASFLGDSNFPHSVDKYVKGLRIEMFQDLYERYSRLALSYPSDRSMAIRGLESRLLSTFGSAGGVGVFDIYLHRSLLWQRASETLRAITNFRGIPVPSWSWMAYDGPIQYMAIPFGEVVWADDIVSPLWNDKNQYIGVGDGRRDQDIATAPLELNVQIWGLIDANSGQKVMDEPSRTFDQPIRCVVLGRSKVPPIDESQNHWVLLVHSKQDVEDAAVYERVGVAVLEKRHIDFDKLLGRVRVQ